ncbi:MAG: pyridoxal-phosphate dependent enzyme, partial [Kordiimonadaceae bacterium]|nr:pyridoxal-phosphate dependent enzyme [Kordiimonadaceae bacterium]
ADGLAAPSTGRACFEIAKDRVKEMLLVTDEQITEALLLLMERCKLYAEPAGAAALAGLLANKDTLPAGSNIVCVVSGGNLDPARLKQLL